jgi:hypothetical protein
MLLFGGYVRVQLYGYKGEIGWSRQKKRVD